MTTKRLLCTLLAGCATGPNIGNAGAKTVATGSAGGGIGSGYSSTPQGKVLAASFMDSHNQLVRAVAATRRNRSKGASAMAER